MGRKRRLNERQVRYAAALVSGSKPSVARVEAGYAREGVTKHLAQLQANPELRALISAGLEGAGATFLKAAETLAEGMDATVVESFCTKDGTLVQTEPMTDHPTRIKAAEITMRLHGAFPGNGAQDLNRGAGSQTNILVIQEAARNLTDEQLDDALRRISVGTFDANSLPSAKAE